MKPLFFIGKCASVVILLFLLAACATIPTLRITYQTIQKPPALKGQEISFTLLDERPDKAIIGSGAEKLYKGFSGNVYYILSKEDSNEFLIGVFDVETLFQKVFKTHLEAAGLTVLAQAKPGVPGLVIRLYDFTLDLTGRKWISRIFYQAELSQDGNTVTRKFKGQGEKYRISGITQSHEVMSETLTDMVNQLDLEELMKKIKGEK